MRGRQIDPNGQSRRQTFLAQIFGLPRVTGHQPCRPMDPRILRSDPLVVRQLSQWTWWLGDDQWILFRGYLT